MSMDEGKIRLRIDLKNGILELDAPPSDFDQAIQKTKELADTLRFADSVEEATKATPDSSTSREEPVAISATKPREKIRASAGKAGSTSRSGRIGSFDPIRDLLSESQHQAIHAFMQEKAPSDQEDQILVAVHKGEQLLGRQGFSYNEIYTLLWRAGVDPLPKAIDVVIQRLIQDQRMDKNDAGFFMKFLGQSRVDKELPQVKKEPVAEK